MRTCKTFPYCWIHTKTLLGLAVRSSTIKNAGNGLFALRDFASGVHIAPYTGEWVNQAEFERRDSMYNLQFNKNLYLDAAGIRSAVGKYANACNKVDPQVVPPRCNAKLAKNTRNRTAWIEAIKNIKKGEEIFVSYGRAYFRNWKH
jgi:hypothetical protein